MEGKEDCRKKSEGMGEMGEKGVKNEMEEETESMSRLGEVGYNGIRDAYDKGTHMTMSR